MSIHYQLKAENLTCQRGDNFLFDNLYLDIQSGDLVQIGGYNGIGKSSLLRILAGLAQPLKGEVLWNGVSIYQQREDYHKNLLYIGHQYGIKPELSVWENLAFYQKISHSQQGDEILWQSLEKVELIGLEDIPAGYLSAGQQRRIALARLWLSKSLLWILDEPFTAIDKKGVNTLTSLFEQHTQKDGIVIFTSHQDVSIEKVKHTSLEQYKY